MALIIDDDTVRRTVTMADAIDALRTAYGAFSTGDIVESPRVNLMIPTGFLRLMAASWPAQQLVGYKEFHRCNGLVRYAYHLYDIDDGTPLAIIDANHLTALRTGACGGVAADLLAAPDADVLAVIGTGSEARSQVEAICAVRDIRRIQAFGRDPDRRSAFCAEMTERHGVDAVPAPDGPSALAGAQIIAVATNTGTTGPAFFGEWIGEHPVHINSIGSTIPRQREIDARVWSNVERIVIDAVLLLEESGDAIEAERRGTLDTGKVALLGDVIAGTSDGRTDAGQRTLYKSVGSALQDLAVAALVYQRVSAAGTGGPELAPFQKIATMQE